jgi:hypothetical protein
MNKLLTSIAAAGMLAITYSTSANSIELPELRLGATYNANAYYGTVTETLKDSSEKKQKRALAIDTAGSFFAEIATEEAYGIAIGYEYAPDGIDIKEKRTLRGTGAGVDTDSGTQTANAAVEDMHMIYISIPVMDTGLYVRAGASTMDVTTKETLATGSSYGNTSVDGAHVGLGYMHDINDRFFVRAEALYTEYDGFTLTGSEEGGTSASYNKIAADDMGSASGRISVGVKF